jgi:hypothetical protein
MCPRVLVNVRDEHHPGDRAGARAAKHRAVNEIVDLQKLMKIDCEPAGYSRDRDGHVAASQCARHGAGKMSER